MHTDKSSAASANAIGDAACAILKTPSPKVKASLTHNAVAKWRSGELGPACTAVPPDRPARPERPETLPPGEMPRRRKGGNDGNRIALLHALAHIELNAIDLAWDMMARFGDNMPAEFIDDWVAVADDEARHFTLIEERLASLGASYGDLPAHNGLWQAARDTSDDIAARLAIVPMVLEARGLDVTPQMIERMKRLGDHKSAAMLDIIYRDEIGHVGVGQKWFRHVCKSRGTAPVPEFQRIVRLRFYGRIKPPFNAPARSQAGLGGEYYEPLVVDPV